MSSSSNPLPRIVREAEKVVRDEYKRTDLFKREQIASRRLRSARTQQVNRELREALREYFSDPQNRARVEQRLGRPLPPPIST
jgi:hypothetical protein